MPFLREWQNWLIVNIPGGNLSAGETLSEYIAPAEETASDYIGPGSKNFTGMYNISYLPFGTRRCNCFVVKPIECSTNLCENDYDLCNAAQWACCKVYLEQKLELLLRKWLKNYGKRINKV